MEDGVAMEIGRSAQLNVAEDLRFGVENVPALFQLMVERSVREIWTNLGNVIRTPVQVRKLMTLHDIVWYNYRCELRMNSLFTF